MFIRTTILSVVIALLFIFPVPAETTDIVNSYVDNETGLVFFQMESGKWGLMTVGGIEILAPVLGMPEWGVFAFHEGYAAVCDEDGVWGYINETGAIVIPFQFDWAGPFTNGLAFVGLDTKTKHVYGHIDTTGEMVDVSDCYYVYDFCEGFARVEMEVNDQYYYLDETGRLAIDGVYQDASDFHEGLAAVKINGKYGFIDTTGDLVIDAVYKRVSSFSEGLAAIKIKKKYGYIDKTGVLVIDAIYKEARNFDNGLAVVKYKTQYGYINATGDLVIDAIYDYAFNFSEGLARVSRNDKYGYIDKSGEEVLPFQYDYACNFEYGLALVELDDAQYLIDRAGTNLAKFDDVFLDVQIISSDEVHTYNDVDETIDYYYRTEDGFKLLSAVGSSFDKSEYYPNEGKKVASLDEAVNLQLRASGDWALPNVDGATALLPVYSALVQAVYPESTTYGTLLTCSKTNGAYERLISEEADIIFVAGPSDAQIEMAKAAGVDFVLTPIGKEAFVFFVSAENPLTGLAPDEIRGIYSGTITDWAQLGVDELGEIVAFQRPKNSGSQTALETLMEGYELIEAQEMSVSDMGEIVMLVEYRNLPNAIGYSFRFYVTDLMDSDVTLLAIDAVEPTVENIRSGEYPLITQFYAVTRKGEENPNVAIFLDWVTSDAGMELIEKAGYVPEY